MAASIKNPARIDHHARRMHFAGDHTFSFNLNPAFGENDAIKSARDHHAVAFDLTLNLRSLAENDGLFRNNVAFHVSVNAERAF